jgi:hypothetical protein
MRGIRNETIYFFPTKNQMANAAAGKAAELLKGALARKNKAAFIARPRLSTVVSQAQ